MDLLEQLRQKGASPEEIETVRRELGQGQQPNVAAFAQPRLDPEPPQQQPWSPDRLKSVLDQLDAKGATREEKDEVIKAAGHDSSRLTNYNPTVRDRMGATVQDAGISGGLSPQRAGDFAAGLTGSRGTGTEQMGLVDLVPGPSNVLAKQDADRDFEQGKNVSGVLNTVAAALPAGRAVVNGAMKSPKPDAFWSDEFFKPVPPPRLSEKAAQLNKTGNIQIKIPRVLDPNNDPISRTATDAAGRASGIPFVGKPLSEKVYEGRKAINQRVAEGVAKTGPQSSTVVAGEKAGDAARKWMREDTKTAVDDAYDALRDTLPKNFRSVNGGNLSNLRAIQQDLAMKDSGLKFADKGVSPNKPVLDAIEGVLTNPNGVTIDDAQNLKVYLSKLSNPGKAVAETGAETGFKRAAGALSKDIERMMRMAGGRKATRALGQAKRVFQKQKKIRDAVEIVMGKGARQDMRGVSGEKVVAKVHGLAKDASGDVIALTKFQRAIREADPKSWDRLNRAVHERMGMNPATGEFDALKWSKAYNSMTPQARLTMNGKELTKELNALSDVLRGYVDATSRIGNPSRSGDLMAGGAILTSALAGGTTGGLSALGALKARWWMSYMGNPRVVRATKKYVNASKNVLTGKVAPTAARVAARQLAIQVELAGGDASEVMQSISGQ